MTGILAQQAFHNLSQCNLNFLDIGISFIVGFILMKIVIFIVNRHFE